MIDTTHPEIETLSALLDGELDAAAHAATERHVTSCTTCAARVDALRALLDEARALPGAVAPPPEVWQRVRAGIEQPGGSAVTTRGARRPWGSAWMLAAAGLVLVVASSWITATIVRQDAQPAGASATAAVPSPAVLPASVARVEAGYLRTAEELEEALARQRPRLAPATIVTIEQSLRTIDEAIAEARRALAEDPGNRGVLELFTTTYEHKLDLLRRAAELSSST